MLQVRRRALMLIGLLALAMGGQNAVVRRLAVPDLSSTVGLATAAGPVIGGLILAVVPGVGDWRWVFYVNVPVGLVALVLRYPVRTVHGRRRLARPCTWIWWVRSYSVVA